MLFFGFGYTDRAASPECSFPVCHRQKQLSQVPCSISFTQCTVKLPELHSCDMDKIEFIYTQMAIFFWQKLHLLTWYLAITLGKWQ